MSSDEIFAAQMWTWPGPMMKRDPSGRILVVNAAFLQIYGGEVQMWAGNTITGWPEPQAPGSSTRFEARVPQPSGDVIYDWLETSLADGSVLSIARDVTVFVNQQQPAPVAAPQPPMEQRTQAAPPVQETVMQAPQEREQPIQNQIPPTEVPLETFVERPAESAPQAYQEEPAQAALPAEPRAEPQRDFERRALPLESENSVLGNNWRDAVIAKAVGISDEEPTEVITDTASDENDAPAGTGTRILLAEDNAINALLTRTLLEAEGCFVEVVEDGVLAVEAMKNAAYDMIFMDMRMPNMDGLEATRKIRSMDHRSKGLPIVALTANAFDDDRNACFDSGMNDFMTKPVSAEELSDMVRIHTGNKEQRLAG